MSFEITPIPVSILLLTLNEESNLTRCLDALSWCDDIVILDSFSNDNTVQVGKHFGAKIFQRKFDNFASQRNFAIKNIAFKHNWIFHLDADEVMTKKLLKEIAETINTSTFDAYLVPSKTMFMGKWIKYSGMYPTYQVRLARSVGFSFRQDGHGQKENIPTKLIGTLREPYLHFSFSKGITEWITKHNRYSSQEAEEIVKQFDSRVHKINWSDLFTSNHYNRRKILKNISRMLPCRPLFRFIYMFLMRLGFLDGYPGVIYCSLLAYYEFMISLKVTELKKKSKKLNLVTYCSKGDK